MCSNSSFSPWQFLFAGALAARWITMWGHLYSWWIVLDIFIIFCFTSCFFRRFPVLCPKAPALARFRNVRIIAHRGGRETTAENTLRAFKNGAEHSECIELDVWLTKDDEVVVFHDEDLNRMCGVSRKIVDCRRASLPLVKFSPSEWSKTLSPSSQNREREGGPPEPIIDDNGHLRIPLLSEVFEQIAALPERPMIIVEFKQHSDLLIAKVQKLIKQYELEHWIIWFSLNSEINNDLKRANPNRLRIMSVTEIAKTYLFYYLGILPFVPLSAHIFGFPGISIPTGFLLRIPLFKHCSLRALELVRFLLQRVIVSSTLVSHLGRRGVPTIVLGVNTIESLQLVNGMGMEWTLPGSPAVRPQRCSDKQLLRDSVSLLTDRPEWLRNIMRSQH